MPNMLLAFDFANPDLTTGKRETTIVPQQALFMMNSPLVVEQARDLVRRDDFKALTRDEDRLALLYRLIYQRKPSDIEKKLAFAYLQSESQAATGEPPEKGLGIRHRPVRSCPQAGAAFFSHDHLCEWPLATRPTARPWRTAQRPCRVDAAGGRYQP
jgi:hypothetical protein